MSKVVRVLTALTLGLMYGSAAVAGQSAGDIANNISNSMTGVGDAIQKFCWVMSFVCGAASCFKFWAYAKDQDREKISTPFLLLLVAALFFAVPMLLDSGASTVWGSNTSINQSKH